MSVPERRATTVEIAGVAGAGKTTLARVLCSDLGFGGLDDTLRLREPRHLKYVARSIPRLAGMSSRWITARRRPTWTELKLIIYLMEWDAHLTGTRSGDARATVLDQGPVYALARLAYVDPPLAGTESHGDWWCRMVDTWADCLDAIIWLDAPNHVLSQRVNARSQAHEIKGTSEGAATGFADRYRASYEEVLSAMERAGGPAILRYDTSRLSPVEIASGTIAEMVRLDLEPGPPTSRGRLS